MLDFLVAHNQEIIFAVTFGGMVLMLLIEQLKPRRSELKSQTRRWLNNIILTILNFVLITLVIIAINSSSLLTALQPDIPLFVSWQLSTLSATVITILVMEFITYWLHRLFHIAPLLWRIHAVHHCDTSVDVTTTHRHHPLEPFLTLLISVTVLILLGAPLLAIIFYNLLHVIISTVSHSNVYVPEVVERWLRYFIVTPDFHRVHHASQQKFTDSNYGAIFPWFDYLFGSAKKLPFKKHETIKLGLGYFRKPLDSRVDQLLLIPFRWR